jgi:hypothetical protein
VSVVEKEVPDCVNQLPWPAMRDEMFMKTISKGKFLQSFWENFSESFLMFTLAKK